MDPTHMDTAAAPSDRWQIKLDAFEGPLDLLLHLVRKEEVDIHQVSLTSIAGQYMEYLELMNELNLNVAGEYILLAATLVYLKSRALIPRELLPEDNADGEGGEDPAEQLIREIEAHQQYVEAARRLAEKQLHQESLWPRGVFADDLADDEEAYVEATLFDLLEAFREIRGRLAADEAGLNIHRKRSTVQEKIIEVARRLHGKKSIDFQSLFEPEEGELLDKSDLISTFLAILELMRLGVIRVLQRARFGTLRVFKAVADEEMEKRSNERIREESID